VLLGTLAAFTYSDYLVDLILQPKGVDELSIISHLEAPGAPYARLLRACDIAAGLLSVALAPYLFRALPRGRLRWLPAALLVVFGVSGALTGIITDPCPDPSSGCGGAEGSLQQHWHVILSGLGDAAILLCPLAVAIAARGRTARWVPIASGVMFAVAIAAYAIYRDVIDLGWADGLNQRIVVSLASAWLFIVGLIGASRPRAASPPDRRS